MQEDTGSVDPLETLSQLAGSVSTQNLIAFAVLIGAIALALVLHWLAFKVALKATAGEEAKALRRVVRQTRAVSRIGFIVIAVELTLPLLQMPDDVTVFIGRIVNLCLIGIAGWLLVMVLRALTDARMSRHKIDVEDNLEARKIRTRMRVLRQMATMLIILITAAAMLMTFPAVRSIGVSMFASAGVAGIVVGFAARPVLSNLLAGIQIALTQPIRIGDAVIMEGEWGWIEEITSTYVVVKIWDWRRLVVPLTQIIEQPFQNWTRETASIIGTVSWHLDYTAPVAEMRKKLKEFLDESELWDGDVQVLQLIDTSQETIHLRALMSAKNSPTAWDLRCEIREKMVSWLQAEYPGALPRQRGQIQIDQSEIKIAEPDRARPADQGGGDGDKTMGEQIGHPEDQPDPQDVKAEN